MEIVVDAVFLMNSVEELVCNGQTCFNCIF